MFFDRITSTLGKTPLRPGGLALGAHVACAALVLLVACATEQPSGADDAEVQAFAAGGYRGADQRVAATSTHAWSISGQALNVVVSLPATIGAAPLVIYLPGLGESSEAGELWRAAWASAGYAVLSVQLLAADERAWTSALARGGEFRKLGLDRFGAPAMHQRLRLLADVVAEGERRASQGEAAWTGIDWNRVAIAGYDVGAYAAMVAAGEHLDGVEGRPGALKIRAAIALSPFANPARASSDRRYRDIDIPVLSVTSNADGDPLGLTDGGGQRGVPFDRMRGPDKYLLTLRDFSHARLGGSASATTPAPTPKRPDAAGGSEPGPRRGTGQRMNREEPEEELLRPRAVERAVVRGLSANDLRMRVLAAQAVSTAFLDASVKNDARARQWLAQDAARWVGGVGTLGQK